MSVASAAASATVRSEGNYITPGDYLLQATAHKENTNDGKMAFIAEHDVLWSKPVPDPHEDDKKVIAAGLSGTLYVDCLKFKGDLVWQVKAYLSALTDTPDTEIDETSIRLILTTDQPCVGALVRCKAWTYVTKNNVRITKTKFSAATPEDLAKSAQYRKDAGLEPLAVVA